MKKLSAIIFFVGMVMSINLFAGVEFSKFFMAISTLFLESLVEKKVVPVSQISYEDQEKLNNVIVALHYLEKSEKIDSLSFLRQMHNPSLCNKKIKSHDKRIKSQQFRLKQDNAINK